MTSTPQLSLSISPHLTALALITDALAGRRRGLPGLWRDAIAARVGRPGHQAVRPLAAPGTSVGPDCLVPLTPARGDATVPEQLAALRDLPPGRLLADLEQAFGSGPLPVQWRSAAERPAAWLHGYASAISEAWDTAAPLWDNARALLDREIRRVGVAAVRGGPEALLGTLSPRLTYGGDRLLVSGADAGTHDLGERPIVLVPMLAGKDALILSLDDREAVWIAYPVPGAATLWRRPAAPARDELSALMGQVRADLLCAVARPKTMSMLAADMQIAPSSITYHCDRLRAARLITRERRGREVWVGRTHRAEELLELFRRT
ncbi:ArsR/SmtB family transcription factor [[Actinomadura] parvosata]|uniref:ArsR/SmtB family transcription factor n=1 Tax=[Actinomadura] parvosata TaxID=1955412 RepID=UPI0012BBF2EC|nr:winged helix-turn-helix domain-containing protein [Nonomuraea sp. ATCC 55076]